MQGLFIRIGNQNDFLGIHILNGDRYHFQSSVLELGYLCEVQKTLVAFLEHRIVLCHIGHICITDVVDLMGTLALEFLLVKESDTP